MSISDDGGRAHRDYFTIFVKLTRSRPFLHSITKVASPCCVWAEKGRPCPRRTGNSFILSSSPFSVIWFWIGVYKKTLALPRPRAFSRCWLGTVLRFAVYPLIYPLKPHKSRRGVKISSSQRFWVKYHLLAKKTILKYSIQICQNVHGIKSSWTALQLSLFFF